MVQYTPVGPACAEITERIRQVLTEASADVEAMAQVIIDRYWQEFRRKNRDQRHLPEDKRQLGRYAPYLRKHKANNKIYLGWRNYQPTRRGTRKGRVMCVDITPAKNLHYLEKQFTAYAKPWEFSLIVRTESELAALRELLEGVHKLVVHLAKCERVFEWKQQQLNETASTTTTLNLKETGSSVVRKTIAELEAELSQDRVINPLAHM